MRVFGGRPLRRDAVIEDDIGALKLPIGERLPALWITVALVLAAVIFSITTDGRFAQWSNLSNIALDASQTLILAVPMTLIIATAGIDLSVGAMVLLTSVLAAKTIGHFAGTAEQIAQLQFPHAGLGIALGVVVALAVGALAGAINGVLIAYARLPAFVVTLGTLGIYSGLGLVVANGTNQVSIPSSLQNDFGNADIFGVLPVPAALALVVALLGWIALRFTKFGIYTLAIGSNPEGARRAGINVRRHLLILYTLAGVAAGLSAIVDLARFAATSVEAHNTDNLDAISAVVLGGTSLFGGVGNVGGTIAGSLMPSSLTNGFILLHVRPFWQPVVIGTVLIAAIGYDTYRRSRDRSGGY